MTIIDLHAHWPAETDQDTRQGRKSEIALCQRCGIPRQVNTSRAPAPLCRDCKSVLPKDMREAWAA